MKSTAPERDWINIAFLTLTPILGLPVTALYTWRVGFQPWMALLFLVMYLLVGISVCAGYHRFFAHRSYDTHRPLQFFYAFFGAMAAQNSILWWASSHRTHHKYVDQDWDPYNIKRGFWWAHILWIFEKNPDHGNFDNARDLLANPVVQWQNRWHKTILVIGGFGIPALVGAWFGDVVAGLLWGGFLRIVLIHHTTFFVNSLAHHLGSRTYNPDESARDNWLVALVTLGEGYHSFHHRFPADFRNGLHWYQWDPAKWWISALNFLGVTRNLRTTSAPLIEQARLHAIRARVQKHSASLPAAARVQIDACMERAGRLIEQALALWHGRADTPRSQRAAQIISHRVRQARSYRRTALRLLERSLQTV